MELKIIKPKKQYWEYLDWIDRQFDNKVKPNSPEGEKVQLALLLIKQYEDIHYPVPLPDSIDAIKLKMQDLLKIIEPHLQNMDSEGNHLSYNSAT
jgi:HTH-type transcriptional regulator/antitoxin HigA